MAFGGDSPEGVVMEHFQDDVAGHAAAGDERLLLLDKSLLFVLRRKEVIEIVNPSGARRLVEVRKGREGDVVGDAHHPLNRVGHRVEVREAEVVFQHRIRTREVVRVRRKPLLRPLVYIRIVSLHPVVCHSCVVVRGRGRIQRQRRSDCN